MMAVKIKENSSNQKNKLVEYPSNGNSGIKIQDALIKDCLFVFLHNKTRVV